MSRTRRLLNYWTKERCLESAKKYSWIKSWVNGADGSGPYCAALRNGWLDECTSHMKRRRPNGYYTKEICLADALKYNHVCDWLKYSPVAMNTAHKNGWYAECTAHMWHKRKWTKEKCMQVASRFPSKIEWIKADVNSYVAAIKNGWLADCSAHMTGRKSRGYWTKERCLADALKYRNVSEWFRKSGGAGSSALTHGWYKEISALIKNSASINEY